MPEPLAVTAPTPTTPETPAAPVAPVTPEVPLAPAATAPMPTPDAPVMKFAGKYADESAFGKGLRELDKALGLEVAPDDAPLWGEQGMYANAKAAEKAYKQKETLLAKVNAPPAEIADADYSGVLKDAGVTEQELAESFNKTGSASDEQVAKIKKARPGITKSIINQQLRDSTELAQLKLEKTEGQVIATHGGRPKVDTMLGWANKEFDKARKDDLDKRLANPATMAAAMDEIAGAYARKVAGEASAPATPSSGPISAGAFATSAEIQKAVRESEKTYGPNNWNKDPQLMARLKATPHSIRAAV